MGLLGVLFLPQGLLINTSSKRIIINEKIYCMYYVIEYNRIGKHQNSGEIYIMKNE